MKITKFFAVFSILLAGCFINQAKAQVDVTVNPFGLLFGDLSLGADFVLAENISLEAGLGIGGGNNDFSGLKWRNIPVTVTAKYYFGPKNGADKFYADVFTRFVSRSYKVDDASTTYAEYSQQRFGLGFGLGYKVASAKGLVFDINFGIGRAFVDKTKFEEGGDQYEVDWTNIMVVGKLGLGYRFGGK